MTLGPDVLRDLGRAAALEWLVTDGLGGYASSSVIGLNTRRYHGLLVAALRPPVDRSVLLSRIDESLLLGGQRHELGTNAYPGTVHPRGFERARAFTAEPLPALTWDVPGGRLTRTVARVQGAPATVIAYALEDAAPARLELRPLLAYRSYHALQRENASARADARREGVDFVLRPYDGAPPLHLRMPGANWATEAYWYRGQEYERERERGFDFREDLWSPGFLTVPLAPGRPVALLASVGPLPAQPDALALLEAERRRARAAGSGTRGIAGALRRAAPAFLVRRGEGGRTVIAGYHWFGDWGRDTMIALPGLCLGGGEARDARAILGEWAGHVRDGLLPNRFPEESEEAEYHAADAALWMVIAVHRYLEATGDRAFVRARLAAAVQHVVEGYRAGTRHGIRMDADGLVEQGEPGLQLTWMDARVDGRVITPRAGLAVEIQALWYNALLIAAALAADAGQAERAAELQGLAGRARRAFLRLFWSDEHGYLADVVGPGGRDLSLRPNQLYAIALPHALVPREIAASVLARVRRDLLTPVGLRTLAPWDQAYVGRYAGDARSRDGAYHQGTVWPFLMGAYFDAAVRMEGEPAKREAREWLAAFAPHVERDAGLGFVSEVFDGDAPHRPGGAIAQAWSVAELLRVALRLDERSGGSRRGPARREPAPGSSARRSQPGSSSQASPDQHISQKHPS